MLIQSNLSADIYQAETQAAQGCGQSDVLYEKRVQKAYRDILDGAPEGDRAAVEIALKERGFDPEFETNQYQAAEGECSLTGIDEDCCPCGRHP
jgi:hypothetical protein